MFAKLKVYIQQHRSIVISQSNGYSDISGGEKQNTFLFEQLYFSPDIMITGTHQLTFIAFLSITAFLGNALILVALRKESSLHPHSKHLLRTLTTTDLCVGLIAEPLFVTLFMTIMNEHWNICRYVVVVASIVSYILCAVSLLTLTEISVDRLLVPLWGLRYRQVVTLKLVYLVTISFCAVATACSTLRILNLIPSVVSLSDIVVISLCLVTSVFSYSTIFLTLRHHQNQVQDHVQQPNQTNQLNIARYRKAVSTALWFQFMLVVSSLPYVILVTLVIHAESSSSVSHH